MKNKIWVHGALALLCSAGLMSTASATLMRAIYTTSGGGVVSFDLDGTIQGDADTVVVNSLLGTPTFNGVAPALGAISGFLSETDWILFGSIPGSPVVNPALLSFSGTILDFLYYNNYGSDGFLLDTQNIAPPLPVYVSGPSYGAVPNELTGNRYSLTLLDGVAVPEPGTLSLLGLSFAGMAFVRRRRKVRA